MQINSELRKQTKGNSYGATQVHIEKSVRALGYPLVVLDRVVRDIGGAVSVAQDAWSVLWLYEASREQRPIWRND